MAIIKINKDNIIEAAKALERGEILIMPCDTFYGFVVNALCEDSVEKIYKLKNRESKKPLGIFVNKEDVNKYAVVNEKAKILMDNVLPAPLNMVLKKKDTVPDFVTRGKDTVMIMCHSIWILQELYNLTGIPMASSSCNYSGEPAATNVNMVKKFENDVDLILDNGDSDYKICGTIVDLIDEPKILRPGAFPKDKLQKYINL